jgi:hypothetical protein
MRSNLKFGVLVVAALLIPTTGCNFGGEGEEKAPPLLKEKSVTRKGSDPATTEQEAILRVLDADKEQFRGGFDGLKPNAQPSAVKKMLAPYLKHMAEVDLTGCPDEFKSAHIRHAKAWYQLDAALGRLPDAYKQSEFMESLYALFAGNKTRGRSLGGDIIAAVERVLVTEGEVYSAASNYGLEVTEQQ